MIAATFHFGAAEVLDFDFDEIAWWFARARWWNNPS